MFWRKKMSRRICSMFLAFILSFTLFPATVLAASSTSGKCGKTATWSFDSATGTLTIAGSGRMDDYNHEWYIPGDSEYDTAAPWLSLADQITKVSIGNEITYIGEEAFSGGGYRSFAYPNLETITFESKSRVTEIGNYAFAEANAVESITLPASLEKIGYESLPVRALEAVYVESGNKTFYTDNGVLYQGKKLLVYPACKEDSSYAILNGTEEIADGAISGDVYWSNSFLTSISIPGSVEKIPNTMFLFCENLSQIDLAEGIKEVDSSAFWLCPALKRVEIPASVTRFTAEVGAADDWLSGDDGLLDIYFRGSSAPEFDAAVCETRSSSGKVVVYYPVSASGWDAVQAQEDVKAAVAEETLEFRTWEPTQTEPDDTLHVKFEYPSMTTGDYATYTDCIYKDNWFFQDSYTYNHELATMSLGLAMSGCDGTAKDEKIKTLLADLGFDNDEYYDMKGYGLEDNDSVAFVMSQKEITNPSDGSTVSLLAISLRGSGYGNGGWAGNFEVGSSGIYHDGWEKAASAAHDSIKKYCHDHPSVDLSTARVWLVGFSRSAAVANVLSQKLRADLFIGENIYTYTFATPSATDISALPNKAETKNIFNIISASDIVPRVPLREWYFWKTGVTKAFTGRLGTFNSLSDPCLVWLEDTLSEAIPTRELYHIGFQNALVDSWKDGMTEDDVLRALLVACVPSALPAQIENFICAVRGQDYQEVADLCASWIKQSVKGGVIANSTPAAVLLQSLRDIALGAVWEQGNPLCGTRDNTKTFNALLDLIHDIANENIGAEKSDLFQNHWPEAYMVLMRYKDVGEYLKDASDRKSKALIVACPVDVEVYDENNALVVKIVDNIVVKPETDSDTVCAVMGDGEKVILLSEGHTYTMKLTATDEGSMDYTVLESYVDGTIARSVKFYDVPLTEGKTFTSKVNDEQNTDKENYALTTEDDVIYPDYDSNDTQQPSHSGSSGGTSSPSYAVSVSSKVKNGTVTVSPRSAEKGDTVTITVKPNSGYQLDNLIATDKDGNELNLTNKGSGKYTFTMPASKVEINATFVKEIETSPFSDVSTSAYYYEAVKWAQEKGITGGIGNGLFGPNQPCTRAQIVTFLWRAAGSPEPKGAASGMTDVVSGSYYEKAVAWAIENGITTGTTATTFSPDATCTRAQAVTFLARALNAKAAGKAEFSDVPANSYFAEAVAWAAANGVTEGVGNGMFAPDNDCTRGQIVTFLYRAYNK